MWCVVSVQCAQKSIDQIQFLRQFFFEITFIVGCCVRVCVCMCFFQLFQIVLKTECRINESDAKQEQNGKEKSGQSSQVKHSIWLAYIISCEMNEKTKDEITASFVIWKVVFFPPNLFRLYNNVDWRAHIKKREQRDIIFSSEGFISKSSHQFKRHYRWRCRYTFQPLLLIYVSLMIFFISFGGVLFLILHSFRILFIGWIRMGSC